MRRRVKASVAFRAFAIVLVGAFFVEAVSAATGSWQRAAPMRKARAAHAVVTDGRSIYALGGTDARGVPVAEVERFDGTRWLAETELPGGGLNAPAAAVLGGRIYVIGGFEATGNVPTAAVRVYTIATWSWAAAAPLPRARGGHAAVVLGGRIHVLGGGDEVSTLADHSVYDPAADRWSALAPLPRAQGSPAAVVFRGRIYAIGGRSGGSDFGDVHVYDAAANRWTAAPRIGPRGTAGAVVYRGAIHVVGGESQARGRTLGDVLRLGPRTWRRVSSLPAPRSFARAVVFRDAVYVVGGSTSYGAGHSSPGVRRVDRWFVRRP